MNKPLLLKHIQEKLQIVHQCAIDAAQRAYDTATDEANEAENKYDTLGLEASYLAHGQSKRVKECEADIMVFKNLKVITFSDRTPVSMGALVCIADDLEIEQLVFISPVAGGLKINFNQQEISLVTPTAPLGKALIKCNVDDEIEVKIGNEKTHYTISAIY
jgi:transcription elongation GreA/GreB family factor